jgi:transcription elongation factor Elf1
MIKFDKKKPRGVPIVDVSAPISLFRCMDCAQRYGSTNRIGRYKVYHRLKNHESYLLLICTHCKSKYQVNVTGSLLERV